MAWNPHLAVHDLRIAARADLLAGNSGSSKSLSYLDLLDPLLT
ncbi:hypothetical protein [Pseudomonas sp. NY15354]